MARPRILLSLLISVPIVVGVSRLYRPHLDVRLGAAVDLLLVAVLFYVILKLFQRFEE
jgi:hypothetical protein